MSRTKFVMLSLVVVFGVTAMASAPALAASPVYEVCTKVTAGTGEWDDHTCSTNGANKKEWEDEPLSGSNGAQTYAIVGTSQISILAGSIGAVKVEIECTKDRIDGYIAPQGRDSVIVKYEECALFEVVGSERKSLGACTIPNITTNKIKSKLLSASEVEFAPESGTVFAEIKIEGAACALKSTQKVEGTQNCALPESEKQLITHETDCKTTGSKLELGKKTATYSGKVHIKLVNEWGWRVKLR
jgi:hypothetical protein